MNGRGIRAVQATGDALGGPIWEWAKYQEAHAICSNKTKNEKKKKNYLHFSRPQLQKFNPWRSNYDKNLFTLKAAQRKEGAGISPCFQNYLLGWWWRDGGECSVITIGP